MKWFGWFRKDAPTLVPAPTPIAAHLVPAQASPSDPLAWLDAHRTELSIGVSPGGEHARVYDTTTKLPHYGHTLKQAAASAQAARTHHT